MSRLRQGVLELPVLFALFGVELFGVELFGVELLVEPEVVWEPLLWLAQGVA